jgi:hypothetical protein
MARRIVPSHPLHHGFSDALTVSAAPAEPDLRDSSANRGGEDDAEALLVLRAVENASFALTHGVVKTWTGSVSVPGIRG